MSQHLPVLSGAVKPQPKHFDLCFMSSNIELASVFSSSLSFVCRAVLQKDNSSILLKCHTHMDV